MAADYLAEEGPLATVVITGATANAAGLATVTFTVKNGAGAPVTGLGAANGASFFISSLAPAGGDLSYNRWISYIWRSSGGVNQAYRERGAFVEGPAGTYTYTFAQNLAAATFPVGGAAITYDRTRTHRVMVALRNAVAGFHGGSNVRLPARRPRYHRDGAISSRTRPAGNAIKTRRGTMVPGTA